MSGVFTMYMLLMSVSMVAFFGEMAIGSGGKRRVDRRSTRKQLHVSMSMILDDDQDSDVFMMYYEQFVCNLRVHSMKLHFTQ
jgi:hypothetical protein